jgi:protein SCO1
LLIPVQDPEQYSSSSGGAAIGGPFSLTLQDGKPITQDWLLGNFTILYFGFGSCPVICPAELEKITAMYKVADGLISAKLPVRTLFISVDPERDTPASLAEYLKPYDGRIVGATGTMEQVIRCAKAYRVYFSKGPAAPSDPLDYNVDHTVIMYLMSPTGEFLKHYSTANSAEDMAKDILTRISTWKSSAPSK